MPLHVIAPHVGHRPGDWSQDASLPGIGVCKRALKPSDGEPVLRCQAPPPPMPHPLVAQAQARPAARRLWAPLPGVSGSGPCARGSSCVGGRASRASWSWSPKTGRARPAVGAAWPCWTGTRGRMALRCPPPPQRPRAAAWAAATRTATTTCDVAWSPGFWPQPRCQPCSSREGYIGLHGHAPHANERAAQAGGDRNREPGARTLSNRALARCPARRTALSALHSGGLAHGNWRAGMASMRGTQPTATCRNGEEAAATPAPCPPPPARPPSSGTMLGRWPKHGVQPGVHGGPHARRALVPSFGLDTQFQRILRPGSLVRGQCDGHSLVHTLWGWEGFGVECEPGLGWAGLGWAGRGGAGTARHRAVPAGALKAAAAPGPCPETLPTSMTQRGSLPPFTTSSGRGAMAGSDCGASNSVSRPGSSRPHTARTTSAVTAPCPASRAAVWNTRGMLDTRAWNMSWSRAYLHASAGGIGGKRSAWAPARSPASTAADWFQTQSHRNTSTAAALSPLQLHTPAAPRQPHSTPQAPPPPRT